MMIKKYDIILKIIFVFMLCTMIVPIFPIPVFSHFMCILVLFLQATPLDGVTYYSAFIVILLLLLLIAISGRILLIFKNVGKKPLIYYTVMTDVCIDVFACMIFAVKMKEEYQKADVLIFTILFLYCLSYICLCTIKNNQKKFVLLSIMVAIYVIYCILWMILLMSPVCSDAFEVYCLIFAISNSVMRDLLLFFILVSRKNEIKKQQSADLVRFSVIPDGYAPECEVIPPCRLNFDTQTTANINRLTRLPTHRRGCNVHLRSYIFGGILSNTERK